MVAGSRRKHVQMDRKVLNDVQALNWINQTSWRNPVVHLTDISKNKPKTDTH